MHDTCELQIFEIGRFSYEVNLGYAILVFYVSRPNPSGASPFASLNHTILSTMTGHSEYGTSVG